MVNIGVCDFSYTFTRGAWAHPIQIRGYDSFFLFPDSLGLSYDIYLSAKIYYIGG